MTQLATEALAYLLDHKVAGRSLLPGAAMFEMAAAAGRTLAGGAADAHVAPALASMDLCLTAVAIPAPVVLAAGGSGALECTVDCRADAVQLAQAPAGTTGVCAPLLLQCWLQRLLADRLRDDGHSVHVQGARRACEPRMPVSWELTAL